MLLKQDPSRICLSRLKRSINHLFQELNQSELNPHRVLEKLLIEKHCFTIKIQKHFLSTKSILWKIQIQHFKKIYYTQWFQRKQYERRQLAIQWCLVLFLRERHLIIETLDLNSLTQKVVRKVSNASKTILQILILQIVHHLGHEENTNTKQVQIERKQLLVHPMHSNILTC